VLIFGHFMACIWIVLGRLDDDNQVSWLFGNNMPAPEDDRSFVWATSFYWIFEVFSTVGYGDFAYSTKLEMFFALLCMFTGVAFNSILLTLLAGLFDEYTYEVMLNSKMDELINWTRKLENCN
jgi:hypothetical protein